MLINSTYNQLLKRAEINKKANFKDILICLKNLGNPQKKLKFIHIAGTNGKGTVANLIAASLKTAGYKVGLFTSPHLVDIRERICINSKMVSKKYFTEIFKQVKQAEKNPLSFFETLTAMAFLAFAEEKTDIAVIETGIGGRLDVTNVITPILSIITSVDFDHKQILGNSLEQIAKEKAGIIKRSVPCIVGQMSKRPFEIIKKTAAKKISSLTFVKKNSAFKYVETERDKFKVILKHKKELWKLSYLGSHQIHNAEIALESLNRLNSLEFCISKQDAKKGFSNTKPAARFQIFKKSGRHIIIDGCHNLKAVKAFIKTYKNSPFYTENSALVFTVMQDKDYLTMIKTFAAAFNHIILPYLNINRAVNPQKIKTIFKKYNPASQVKITRNFNLGFKQALKYKTALFAGSFYIAGKAISAVKKTAY